MPFLQYIFTSKPEPILFRYSRKTIPTFILLVFIALIFNNCNPPKSDTIVRLDGSEISSDSLVGKINQLMDKAKVTGMAVSIFNDNQTVFQKVFGYKNYPEQIALNDSTNIYGASLSKAIFSILVMDLVEDGIIDLDTPLESYLPKKIYEYEPKTRWHDDYSALKNDSLYHKITARMCLNHTSGFANWRTAQLDIQTFKEPGKEHMYSGEGFVYLQVVLEKITGEGLQQLALERIFEPLGMKHSAFLWKPEFKTNFALGHDQEGNPYEKDIDNEPRSASTLETTAADYTKFMEAVLNQKLISEESYRQLFSKQIKITSPTSTYDGPVNRKKKFEAMNYSYGLGWGILDTPYGTAAYKGGNGSGFQHYSIIFPKKGVGILIMTNSRNGRSTFIELLELTLKDIFSTLEIASRQHLDAKNNIFLADNTYYKTIFI